jgi:hypothetical protein
MTKTESEKTVTGDANNMTALLQTVTVRQAAL